LGSGLLHEADLVNGNHACLITHCSLMGHDDKRTVLCNADLGARRGIKNDSSDIIELSKGFHQPIAIVSISKKRKLCLSLSIDGQFTVIHYPSIPSYHYLIVKGLERKKTPPLGFELTCLMGL